MNTRFTKLLMPYIAQQAAVSAGIEMKQQECINLYWSAVNLPRKQKKKLRKAVTKDYNFLVSMETYNKNVLGF